MTAARQSTDNITSIWGAERWRLLSVAMMGLTKLSIYRFSASSYQTVTTMLGYVPSLAFSATLVTVVSVLMIETAPSCSSHAFIRCSRVLVCCSMKSFTLIGLGMLSSFFRGYRCR